MLLKAKGRIQNYLERIATTGFIFAAIDAGIMPDKTPSITQIVNASTITLVDITMGKGRIPLSTNASPPTMSKPMIPPMTQRNALSN